MTICFALTFAILSNAERILLSLGQDKQASKMAQVYIYYCALPVYINSLNDGTRRFLNSLSLSFIPFQINAFGILAQVVFCKYFVQYHQMGMKGVGLSIGLANAMIFTGLNIYPLFVKEARGAMRLPSLAAFRNLSEYLRKGVPLSLMIFVEWLAFEFLILMSGALGVAEQAT